MADPADHAPQSDAAGTAGTKRRLAVEWYGADFRRWHFGRWQSREIALGEGVRLNRETGAVERSIPRVLRRDGHGFGIGPLVVYYRGEDTNEPERWVSAPPGGELTK